MDYKGLISGEWHRVDPAELGRQGATQSLLGGIF